MLRATVSECASLAGFPVLATAPIGGDVVGAVFTSTESILAARIALIVSTAVSLCGTAVAERASFADFAIDASTTAVTGDLAGCAVASTELGLTTSIAVLCLDATPSSLGTTASIRAARAGLPIEASTAAVGRDGTRISIAGAESSLTTCTAMALFPAEFSGRLPFEVQPN